MKTNSLIFFLIIAAFALLVNVGSFGVVESSDARYAEIGRAMYVSSDYLHPNLMEIHHYHKPPLTYQITAFAYSVFGINAFAARFFLQIAILIQIILVYYLSLELFNNRKTALWSALIYFSFPMVLVSSRNLTTDAYLTTFAILGIYTWVKYRKTGKYAYLYIFTTSMALGFLTKGPVVFIVPFFFIISYNRIEKAKNRFSLHHIIAWLLFLGLASWWFIYLAHHNQTFIDYFLGKQTVDRFSKNAFNRSEPFWYFWAYAPLTGLPWLVILPFMIKNSKNLFNKKSIYTVLVVAFLVPLIFFSISSSKRILYILPLYSMFALLVAQLLDKAGSRNLKLYNYFIFGYAFVILIAFSILAFINTGMLISTGLSVFAILTLILVFGIFFSNRFSLKTKQVYIAFTVSAFLVIGSSKIMSDNQLKVNSSKPVTDFLIQNNLNNRTILIYNTRKPSIEFHLNKTVISLYDGDYNLNRETQFEDNLNWKKYLVNLKDDKEIAYLKQVLEQPTVFLTYRHNLPENRKWIIEQYENRKEMGKWVIYW